ncbi:MAG: hypothetical protein HY903_00135 [Deltaproteobacteria bacterium]|nr:hypothetical protein [Deltaproteobacteria bacterium]
MELRPPPRAAEAAAPGTWPRLLMALQLLTMIAVGALAATTWLGAAGPKSKSGTLARDLASKLKAAGATDEAAALYEEYLEDSADADATRAKVAYSLGNVYLEGGQYEKALRWFYAAEMLGAKELSQELGERIVMCLERLGRVQAARAALSERTQVGADAATRPADDLVLAKIGEHEIRASDLQAALDDLPPELSERYRDPGKREEFLKKVIADQLIWQKAQKLGYDKDPVVRRRFEALFKQLAIGAFVEKEIVGKVVVQLSDLKNFFEANRERLGRADTKGGKQKTFEELKPQVEREYRMLKTQEAYQTLIQQELQGAAISLYPENLKKAP